MAPSSDEPTYAELDSVCLARSAWEASHIAAILRAHGLHVYIAEETMIEQTTTHRTIPIWVQKHELGKAEQIILDARLSGLAFMQALEDLESGVRFS